MKSQAGKLLKDGNGEKLPSMIINAIVVLADEKRRRMLYAVDEGAKTLAEIARSTMLDIKTLRKGLHMMTYGGLLDRKMRKNRMNGVDIFEDIYEITSFCDSLVKCLFLSLSRDAVEKATGMI